MGWTYTAGSTRDELVEERIEAQSFDSIYEPGLHIDTKTEQHKLTREDGESVLWKLQHTIKTDRKTGNLVEDRRWIALDILAPGSGGYGWGYKDMSEEMGPYFSSCPCDWFTVVPSPGPYADQFRARCRAVQGVPDPQPLLFGGAA